MSVTDFNEKPIESEVFRFVSVRNPQRITKNQLNKIGINYSFEPNSDFYDDLVAALEDPANETNVDKHTACRTLAEAYAASVDWIENVDEVGILIGARDGLYDWLQENMNGLTIAAVTARFSGIGPLLAPAMMRLWDNLFARVILGGDGPTRASIIESICLNNLIAKHANEDWVADDNDLLAVANARVILPGSIFPLPAIRATIPEEDPTTEDDSEETANEALDKVKKHQQAYDELEELRLRKREELFLESYGVIPTEEDPNPFDPNKLNFVLTEEDIDGLSVDTASVLGLYNLGEGNRLTFCLDTIGRKLSKAHADLLAIGGIGRRVLAVGGAIWESSGARFEDPKECGDSDIPDTGSDDDYISFYGGDAKCKIKPLGVGDLLLVKQKLCCYAPGEVAHIENVLQGEYKERSTRRLRRTEDTFITSTERETLDERDTVSTTQNEMQNSTSTVLQEDMSFNVGMSLGVYGGVGTFNLNSGFATSSSSNTANTSATVYAQSVTSRALQRIIERTKTERITKVIDEYEENNKHGLDNRGGTAHVVGLYRWTDKIYEAKLVNYGKRLMFEFLIPEPGAFHLWAMAKPSAGSAVELIQPVDPRSHNVTLINLALHPLTEIGITRTNYHIWGAVYGVVLDPPPIEEQIVSKAYAADNFTTGSSFARSFTDLVVPDGYYARSFNFYALFNSSSTPVQHWISVSVGTDVHFYMTTVGNHSASFAGNVVGTVPVSIVGGSDFFALNVHLWCFILSETFINWQKGCFEKIMNAYFQKKAAYDEALAQAKAGYGNGIFGTNPAMNRQIEQNELRKACLNALFNGANFSSDAVANHDSQSDCKPPMALTDCCAVYQGERVKFLEQLFEWNYLAYMFYPYYHGQKCRWKMLYQLQDSDPDFLKFLQSGMARVIVPVRLGFEETAMHFLSTGQIWSGGPVPAIKNDLYLSIVQEIMGAVEYHGDIVSPTWEIRVPTSLTVLQCNSGCASGEGLPCDCGTGIGTGTSTMVGIGSGDPTDPAGHGG